MKIEIDRLWLVREEVIDHAGVAILIRNSIIIQERDFLQVRDLFVKNYYLLILVFVLVLV